MAKVLLKALDILALFDRDRPEWAEHEVATALALPTSTAHRLLGSLRNRGYVVRVKGGRYRLGPAAIALGRRAADDAVAPGLRAALERVAAETGETAVVGIRDPAGGGLLILDRIESTHRLRMVVDVGHVVPLHAGAGSKALLAHLAPAEIERVAAGPLPRLGPATITDPGALLRDLETHPPRGPCPQPRGGDRGRLGGGIAGHRDERTGRGGGGCHRPGGQAQPRSRGDGRRRREPRGRRHRVMPGGAPLTGAIGQLHVTVSDIGRRSAEITSEPHVVHRKDDIELWIGFLKDPDGTALAIMSEEPAPG